MIELRVIKTNTQARLEVEFENDTYTTKTICLDESVKNPDGSVVALLISEAVNKKGEMPEFTSEEKEEIINEYIKPAIYDIKDVILTEIEKEEVDKRLIDGYVREIEFLKRFVKEFSNNTEIL